jgi:hypothetical protein
MSFGEGWDLIEYYCDDAIGYTINFDINHCEFKGVACNLNVEQIKTDSFKGTKVYKSRNEAIDAMILELKLLKDLK